MQHQLFRGCHRQILQLLLRVGQQLVTDPKTGAQRWESYTYEVEVPYTYRICDVKLENKNMETDARVKNYGMEILSEGAIASGRWTGGVKTSVRNAFLTFPLQAAYKVHPRTNLKLGVFLSYLIEGKFDGVVYDGYLRNGDPTGEKAVFTGDATATYDFSDELRKFQWGLQAGVDWEAFKHLKLYADLSWGLNSAFPESFKTITFSMYPIYFNVGVGYLF